MFNIMLSVQLKSIMKANVLCDPKEDGSVTLKEKKMMTFKLAGVPSEIAVIKLDDIGQIKGIEDNKCRQICDYVVFCRVNGRETAIFIELKKTLYNGKKKGMEQLYRSVPLAEYLDAVCRLHYDVGARKSPIDYRFFLVCKKSTNRFDKQICV
ncbi:MAG: hypothetical protein F4053_08135 [Proteobacteria bacterium]|nr:hypothetical protein [Pseudomonadota bacterium]